MNKTATPKLRFPEFQDSEDWKEKQLIDVCIRVTQGGTPDTSNEDYWNGSLDWLTPAEMGKTETRFINSTVRKITEEGLRNCSSELLPINSVILSTRAPIGHLAINTSPMAINQGCKGLVPNDLTNYDFLYYSLLNSKTFLIDLGAGNIFKELSGNSLKSFEMMFPKLPEQQKIADCLTSLDDLIVAQSQKVEALQAYKKGLLQNLFPAEGESVPRLRFPEFESAGGWEIKPLGIVAENLDNSRIPITESDRVKGEIPYYGASGIIDHVNDFIFDEDLLCISEDGANLVARTYPIAFSISGKSWVNNHAHVLRFQNKSTQIILENYLNFTDLEDYLTGMAQPKLNRAMLDEIPIPLPHTDEQQRIAELLTALDEQISAQGEALAGLKVHKRGLLQGLFPNQTSEVLKTSEV